MLDPFITHFLPFYFSGVAIFAVILGAQHESYTHNNPRFDEGPGHAVIIALFWPVTLLVVGGYVLAALWRKYMQ